MLSDGGHIDKKAEFSEKDNSQEISPDGVEVTVPNTDTAQTGNSTNGSYISFKQPARRSSIQMQALLSMSFAQENTVK